MILFSRRIAVLTASSHKPFLKKVEKFPLLSMEETLLNWVANSIQYHHTQTSSQSFPVCKPFLFVSPFKIKIFSGIIAA